MPRIANDVTPVAKRARNSTACLEVTRARLVQPGAILKPMLKRRQAAVPPRGVRIPIC